MKPQVEDRILLAVSIVALVLYLVFLAVLDVPSVPIVLTYLGFVCFGFGIALVVLSYGAIFRHGTDAIMDTGIYGVTRHPMFLGIILMFFSWIFFAPHWLIIVDAIVGMISTYWRMVLDERANVERFGDAYERYMQAVPRINLLAGFARLRQRGKRK
jgi:protein-S-isoprenylcysteine O-methyltransferase Ste14